METKIALFRGSGIRKTFHNNEWWFVVDDVVGVLADTVDPSGYIKDIRHHDKALSKGWGQIVTPLWVEIEGGKKKLDCANTERIFRIIEKKTGKRVVSPEYYRVSTKGLKRDRHEEE